MNALMQMPPDAADLNEEQQAFREAARDFADKELAPHAAEWDAKSHFPREAIAKAAELGFCGLYTDEAVGGLGMKRLDAAVVFEELAAVDPSTSAFISIHNMATWLITRYGNEGVRAHWGPALTSGARLASYCLTEPGSGSDAASLKTRAVRDGDDYVIDGSKAFISGAGATEVLVVMARTGEDGARGISAFVVPADAPGIAYGRKEEKMGWNSQPTRGITFTAVRIPAGNLLGAEGEGFKLAMKALDGGRINIAACSLGAAQGALDAARRYMGERRQFGRKLADFQALQFKLADMATQLVA
ncbi:acyl-CoA dehydrogenase, partial [Xanthomonas sp. Kuri4-2]